MADVLTLQREIHSRLISVAPCFLRVCADDRSLWVSDLPRKCAFPASLSHELRSKGIDAWEDSDSRLLCLDLSLDLLDRMAEELPAEIPVFPQDERFLELHALCRLLLAHPCPLKDQPMPLNRQVLKLVFYPRFFGDAARETLLSLCSERLRHHASLPYLGGQLLSAVLSQKGDFPCCLNT